MTEKQRRALRDFEKCMFAHKNARLEDIKSINVNSKKKAKFVYVDQSIAFKKKEEVSENEEHMENSDVMDHVSDSISVDGD